MQGLVLRARRNPLLDRERGLRPEWRDLFEEFPDRVMLATDQFYAADGAGGSPDRLAPALQFARALSPALAPKIGWENARRVFGIR